MTFAFFSDIHANLPALEAVLEDIERRRPDTVFCLGDLVGYAPWPNEVVRLIRDHRVPTIAGNYDEGVGLNSDDCGCAYKTPEDASRGAQSIAFTNSVISDSSRAYLSNLPRHFRITIEPHREPGLPSINMLLVHGSPRRINEYLFEDRPDSSFRRIMQAAGADIMLFGHTHKPYHKQLAGPTGTDIRHLHAINIGSVGKPKDGDPRACYAIVDVAVHADGAAVNVDFVRVDYDIEKSATAIESSPLPNAFADMLRRAY